VLVCLQEEQNLSKSFRNLERVVVIGPSEVEVGAVVWARSLLVSEAALPLIQGKAQ
jgi:ribosomal protein L4